MKPGLTQEADNELVLSFIAVRQALGYLGVFLPIALGLIGVFSGDGIAPSISEFYFTSAGDLLVGVLCAIGVFLLTYKGFDKRPDEIFSDVWIARLAAVGALGVAFIPTKGPVTDPLPLMHRLIGVDTSRSLHYASATLFFVCLAIFCLVLFCRHDAAKPMDEVKKAQNKIYIGCGWVIVATIVLMGAFGIYYQGQPEPAQQRIDSYDIIYVLESIGVLAFALSWLTKGKTLKPLERLVQKLTPSGAGDDGAKSR